ncbi:antiterminator Q family protein [Serratia fonticola]
MRDMYEVLSRWGVWARDNKGVGYSSIAAGFKEFLPRQSSGKQSCSDDDGMMVDRCIAKLKGYNLDEYEIVIMHYFYGVSLRKIAKRRKCSDGKVRKQIQAAEGFISGCLFVIGK